MFLSIVESGSFRDIDQFDAPISRSTSSKGIEFVGPVFDSCITKMRNRGAQAAAGEWIFFKDADCTVVPTYLLASLQRFEKLGPSIAAVGGVYESHDRSVLEKSYGLIQKNWVRRGCIEKIGEGLYRGHHLLGGGLLVRRSALRKVSGFCEKNGWGGEEKVFVQALQRAGLVTLVDLNMVVRHDNRMSLFGFIKRAWAQNVKPVNLERGEVSQKRSVWSYFRVPFVCLAPTVLFFAIATIAKCVGLVKANL